MPPAEHAEAHHHPRLGCVSAQRPRVLMVEPAGAGGMAHYTFNLCQALVERCTVTLATSVEYELADLERRFAVYGIFRPALVGSAMGAAARARAAAENLGNVTRLTALCARIKPSVVHDQGPVSPRLGSVITRVQSAWGGVATVATVHEVLPYEDPHHYVESWRRAYAAHDVLIAHSRYVAAEYRRTFGPPRDMWIVPHGDYTFFRTAGISLPQAASSLQQVRASARRSLGVPEDAVVFLFAGYMRPYKGVDVLCRAWPLAVDRGLPPGSLLIMVGSVSPEVAPFLDRLESVAGERVRIVRGYVTNATLTRYLEAADAMVAPYHQCFTSGIVPLAFSFGLPVVATRVGALAESIRSGYNGLLVAEGDEESFARALVRAADARFLARASGGALQSASSISWDQVARRTETVYQRVLAKKFMKRSKVFRVTDDTRGGTGCADCGTSYVVDTEEMCR